MLDNWQRIEQIIKWAGSASVSAFAREIGLNRSENLYQIKRGNNGISKELADIISSKYPQISKAWLLTGEGQMIPSKARSEKYDIPFFKADAVDFAMSFIQNNEENDSEATANEDNKPAEPSYYISFPMFRGCNFATFSFSDAMAPEIPPGSILFFQESHPKKLMPGNTYLILSPQFQGIRYIRKEPESNNLRLVAKNRDLYDDIILDIDSIHKLFQVKGVLINK